MEFKHFSHNHGLVFHPVPQGSQIHCSGCKSSSSGNVYVCWQCGYFLHEQCFRASRSLKHLSHPLHPLTLVPFPTYPSGSFFCNSCNLGGDGFSYSCSKCEFDIHIHCALTPNANTPVSPAPNFSPQNLNSQPQNPIYPPHNATIPNDTQKFPPQPQTTSNHSVPNNPFPSVNPAGFPPNQHNPPPGYPLPNVTPQNFVPPVNASTTCPPSQPPPQPSVSLPTPAQISNPQPEPPTTIKHFSHPHLLKQMEIEHKNAKVCSACECELLGSAYCCIESHCTFNLHKACFDSPREVRHRSHLQHPLTLLTAPPYNDGFTCNPCLKVGKAFAYNCAACSYDLHIDCTQRPETVTRPDHKHPLTLYYSSTFTEVGTFICDVCKDPVHETAWVYYCRECDFGTHLDCVLSEIKQQSASGEKTEDIQEQLFRLQQQQAILDFQMQMAKQNAEFMTSLANPWKNFY